MRLLLPSLAVLLLMVACTESRGPYGFITDAEGNTLSTRNPANVQKVHGQRLSTALAEALGSGWTVVATIAEEPEYDSDEEFHNWKYPTATVSATATAPDGASLDQAAIGRVQAANAHFFRNMVKNPTVNLRCTVVPAAAVAQVPADPPPVTTAEATATTPVQTAPATTPPAPAVRTYTVQTGDTLALISAVFYGSADHWRLLVDANPGLDPQDLRVGQVITIPAKP